MGMYKMKTPLWVGVFLRSRLSVLYMVGMNPTGLNLYP